MKFHQLLHHLRSLRAMQSTLTMNKEVSTKGIGNLAKSFLLKGSLILLCAANAQAVKFQAEDYSNFSDNTAGNEGGVYRHDDVDIQPSNDTGAGYNLGWIDAGEWLAYSNLSIPVTGSYIIKLRVASPTGATASVDLNGGSIRLGNFVIPATGGWQTWTTLTRTLTLQAGTYNLGVFAQTAGWNFNWIEVISNTPASSSKSSASIPSSIKPSSIPSSTKASSIPRSIVPSSISKSSIPASSLPPASVGTSTASSIPRSSLGSSSSTSSTTGHAGWDEVWVDNFNGPQGTGVDKSIWDYDLGTCYLLNGACTPNGDHFGTFEVETMTDSTDNVYLDGQGHLLIKPIHTGNIPEAGWTSGRIETKRLDFNAPVGGIMRMEGRLKQPNVSGVEATGYWPAFWALGSGFRGVYTNWPKIGEIDIMEVVNGRDSTFATLHCGVWAVGPCNETTGLGTGELPNPTGKTEFHIYAMEYDRSKSPEEIRWYLDDKLIGTVKQNQGLLATNPSVWSDALHHKGFFMLLNVSMGGAFPIALPPNNDITVAGTKSGVPMIVDYVGVWYKIPAPCTPNVDCPPPPQPPVSTPYLDANGAAVPGIVQFKNFDKGGQGVAFNDTTPTNKGAYVYRTDITGDTTSAPVDIASNCGGCVNYVDQGEWLNYSINVATAGTYSLYINQAGAGGGSFHVELEDGSDLTGAWVQPKTTNWDTYQTEWKQIALPAGKHILKFVFDSCTGSLCALNNVKEFELKFDSAVVASRSAASASSRASSSSASSIAPRTQVWSDEFDTINLANWSYETGGGGWGNNELQNYTNGQNSAIQFDTAAGSNVLVITASKDNSGNFTSSRMISYNKKMFKYGRLEARLKLPQTQGIWPAFWMMGRSIKEGTGWPQCGEVDIMEHIGSEPNTTHGAMHGPGYSGATPIAGTNLLNERVDANYHVYAVEWDTNGVKWFMDGVQFYSTTKTKVQTYGNWVFDQEMYILLNVAVGGGWPGNPDASSTFPQKMYVDYVRVYQ